jgi:hypothetical protein
MQITEAGGVPHAGVVVHGRHVCGSGGSFAGALLRTRDWQMCDVANNKLLRRRVAVRRVHCSVNEFF